METRISVFINGFGRIGRATFRAILQSKVAVNVVGINDANLDIDQIVYLFTHDSVQQVLRDVTIQKKENKICVSNEHHKFTIRVSKYSAAKDIYPVNAEAPTILLDCSGKNRTYEKAKPFLKNNFSKVIISSPAKDKKVPFICFAANHNTYVPNSKSHHIISNPSKVLDGVDGKIDGIAIRVPIECVSNVDLKVALTKEVTKEEVDEAFRRESETEGSVLGYSDELLVSRDFVGRKESVIYTSTETIVLPSGKLIRIVGWFDNEAAYGFRMLDLALHISREEEWITS
eukprot:maker-scaffold_8-snap-gene-4.8-mRNA-1 protein AED:0.29 eAED:0.29 QI:0/0/0.5/1/0/0/2/93/286